MNISVAGKSDALELTWQWPNERKPEKIISVKLSNIEKVKKGWFGFNQSPSIAKNLPDATEVSGDIVNGKIDGKTVSLILPAPELSANLKVGEVINFLLLNENICIGITRIEN